MATTVIFLKKGNKENLFNFMKDLLEFIRFISAGSYQKYNMLKAEEGTLLFSSGTQYQRPGPGQEPLM